MFTGLIEDVGRIERWRLSKRSGVLTIATKLPLRELKLGSSIAVNGACLTVVQKGRARFVVDVSPETLRRTKLATLQPGDSVNLERPLRVNDRLGGHLVTGHVDGIAVAEEIKKRGDFTFFTFRIPVRLEKYLVPKGSIAVDGISLTVNQCARQRFSVAIIPFTLNHTNLRACGVGDKVNVEIDLIGKYVEKFIRGRR